MNVILIFGTDSHLLKSRYWLFKARGYHVLTARTLSDFPPESVFVDILLACHTVSPADRDSAFRVLGRRWPSALTLSLVSIGGTTGRTPEESFNTIEGPARLLHRVDQLLPARVG